MLLDMAVSSDVGSLIKEDVTWSVHTCRQFNLAAVGCIFLLLHDYSCIHLPAVDLAE